MLLRLFYEQYNGSGGNTEKWQVAFDLCDTLQRVICAAVAML
jgi:hypothetical protein